MTPEILPVICIAGDAKLAAQLSARFAVSSTYFAVMEEPRVGRPDASAEIMRRTNLLGVHDHDLLILAGCSSSTIELLTEQFPPRYASSVITIQDMKGLKEYSRVLARFTQIDKARKEIVTPDELPSVPRESKLAVIERSGSVGQVIAENFCVAEGYHIMFIDEASQETVDEIEESLRQWNLAQSSLVKEESRAKLFKTLRNSLSGLDEYCFRQLVFFTRGIPYGVLPFRCPVSHLFQELELGIQVLNAYHRLAEEDGSFAVAVLCDPGDLCESETVHIEKLCETRGIETIALRGSEAEVTQFDHIVTRYPFDLLFISAHGGEISGKRVTATFTSSKGENHTFVSDRYTTCGDLPGFVDDAMIYQMVVPVSLDGVPWSDSEAIGKHLAEIGFDWEEFQHYSRHRLEDEEVLAVEDVKSTKFSNAIALNGSPWMPMLYVAGESRLPVVFNNACSSWIQMAFMFLFAGASVYIGTTKDILETLAYECGKDFLDNALRGIPLSEALHLSQKQALLQASYSPYLYWGHPDIRLIKPENKSCREIRESRVEVALKGLSALLTRITDEKLKKMLIATIKTIQKFR